MAEIQTITADPRERAGKGTARAARRDGKIPAVIYGNNEDPILITLDQTRLQQELNKNGFFIRLIDVEVEGKKHRVLPRDTQFHPVSDYPLHVDFLRYSADRKLSVDVPVAFLNEDDSPGLKTGGVLNVVRHTIEILCVADSIPETFQIDLSGLEVGDSIHASALSLTEGVELAISDRDFTIATIAAPTILAIEEDVEEVDGEESEEEAGEESTEDTEDGDNDNAESDE